MEVAQNCQSVDSGSSAVQRAGDATHHLGNLCASLPPSPGQDPSTGAGGTEQSGPGFQTASGDRLFKHLNIILEAYRSYEGVSWFLYDDRVRQKISVHKSMLWGLKDIDLWMGI
ncbi:hypothetical protein XELAEV_18027259mg [Xenopus laevis]|uniref:Uncharacterized protein n=1 Tax=Xenopus laevis TaxID=8355 RepID=A0A974HJS0_XENLA|nr:hypothetical protein XELAEV_18027259mg [Xenopus laevis]